MAERTQSEYTPARHGAVVFPFSRTAAVSVSAVKSCSSVAMAAVRRPTSVPATRIRSRAWSARPAGRDRAGARRGRRPGRATCATTAPARLRREAQRDGWGDPVGWLRAAERYFHDLEVPAVAGACRALLRRAGARVPQRRSGADQIPQRLRSAGVTVREFEVLGLLIGRLGNQEIDDRLQVSPRTVERHVGNLMTKTGLPNRIALGRLAADVLDTDDELV